MTVTESSTSPTLAAPEEPSQVRTTLRTTLLGGADWRSEFGDDLAVGAVFWSSWEAELRAGGLDRTTFDEIVRGYQREIWFWVLGDRIWEQVAEGLAGRVIRRLPAS